MADKTPEVMRIASRGKGRPRGAKTEKVLSSLGRAVTADCGAEVPRHIGPGTAAHHPIGAVDTLPRNKGGSIRGSTLVVVSLAILNQFPDIADHLTEAPRIRCMEIAHTHSSPLKFDSSRRSRLRWLDQMCFGVLSIKKIPNSAYGISRNLFMKIRMAIVVMANFIVWGTSASAIEECNNALIVEHYDYKGEISTEIAASSLVNESQFDEIKRNFSAGGSGVIYGIPVSADTSYEKYDAARKSRQVEESLNFDQESAISWSSRRLGDNALTAYNKCLEVATRRDHGIQMWIEEERGSEITVVIFWSPPPGAIDDAVIEVDSLSGTTTQASRIPKRIAPNGSRRVTFRKSPAENFRLSINANGYGGTISVDREPLFGCKNQSDVDSIVVEYFTGRRHQACNACGSCSGPGQWSELEKKTVDLACLQSHSANISEVHYGHAWDCSWNGSRYPVFNLLLGDEQEVLSIVTDCKTITDQARGRGLSLPAGVCN